jgi:hypothetical protein
MTSSKTEKSSSAVHIKVLLALLQLQSIGQRSHTLLIHPSIHHALFRETANRILLTSPQTHVTAVI